MNPEIKGDAYISLYKQLVQDSCDEYRHFKYKMATLISSETSGVCPACPSGEGNVFISMDACFSLVKRRQDVTKIEPLHSGVFLDQAEVDHFVENYGVKQNCNDIKECNDFKAVDRVRSSATNNRLNVTAVFGASCKHEIPLALMDLRHGERFSYGIFMMKHMKTLYPEAKLHVLYDVACMLSSHIKRNCPELADISLAIPVFHAYGHKTKCQLLMNPRRLASYGMLEGECVERLWSFLGKFSKITKEMTTGIRKDLLTDAVLHFRNKKIEIIGATLCQKLERAKKTEAISLQRVEELKSLCDKEIREEHVEQWFNSEQKTDKKEQTILTWQEKYVEALENLRTTRFLIVASRGDEESAALQSKADRLDGTIKTIEKSRKIQTRWKHDSEDYLVAKSSLINKQRVSLLQSMRIRAKDIQFLNSLRAKYTDGQKVAIRLAKQQKAAASLLQKSLRNLNAISEGQHPPLQYTDVNTSDAAIYTEQCPVDHQDDIPVYLKRDIVDNWLRAKRATEEMTYVHSEMTQVEMYYKNLSSALDTIYTNLQDEQASWKYNDGLVNIIKKKRHLYNTIIAKWKAKFLLHQNVTPVTAVHEIDLETLEEMYFPQEEEEEPSYE